MMYYRENDENKEKITEKKYSASNVILNIKMLQMISYHLGLTS